MDLNIIYNTQRYMSRSTYKLAHQIKLSLISVPLKKQTVVHSDIFKEYVSCTLANSNKATWTWRHGIRHVRLVEESLVTYNWHIDEWLWRATKLLTEHYYRKNADCLSPQSNAIKYCSFQGWCLLSGRRTLGQKMTSIDIWSTWRHKSHLTTATVH